MIRVLYESRRQSSINLPLAFRAPEQTNLPLSFCPLSGSFHPFCPSPCLLPFSFAFLSYLSLSVLLRVCLFLVRALSTSAPYQSRGILPLASLPRPSVSPRRFVNYINWSSLCLMVINGLWTLAVRLAVKFASRPLL